MAANLETVSQLERRLNIALVPADIDSAVQERLKQLSRNVKMHGFRPGKVPMKVVAQQYEGQARGEVIGDLLQKHFGETVREQNLRVAGYPRFEIKDSAKHEYSATFEVLPEVTPGDLSKTTLHRVNTQVGDAEIDHTIDIMRKQRAKFEKVERAAQDGDRVTLDFKGTIDGVAFPGGSAQGAVVVLGQGQMLPDFEKNILGQNAGSTKSFELKFPEDYHGKEVAGKTSVFEIHITEVAAPKLPEVDADFAKMLGVADGDIAKMRAEIRANLEREVKARVKQRLKDEVMQALLDTTQLEVPKALIEMEIERLTAMAKQDLEARGIKTDGLPFPRDVFETQAQRRVKLGLILAEVVSKHALQAKPEQVRALVEEQAQSYEQPQQVVKWVYQSPERLRDAEAAVVENNVVEWAARVAKSEEQIVPFDELMGQKQA